MVAPTEQEQVKVTKKLSQGGLNRILFSLIRGKGVVRFGVKELDSLKEAKLNVQYNAADDSFTLVAIEPEIIITTPRRIFTP